MKIRGDADADIRRALFNSTIASDDTRSVKSAMPGLSSASKKKSDANYLPPDSDDDDQGFSFLRTFSSFGTQSSQVIFRFFVVTLESVVNETKSKASSRVIRKLATDQQLYENLSISRTPNRTIQRLKQQEVSKSPSQSAKKVSREKWMNISKYYYLWILFWVRDQIFILYLFKSIVLFK